MAIGLLATLALVLAFRGSPIALASNMTTPQIESLTTNPAPSMALEPKVGPVGTRVVVAGYGFSANVSLTVRFDGKEIVSFSSVTGASGNFSASFIVPDAPSGDREVEVSDGTIVAAQNYAVTPSAAIAPQSGYGSIRISVTGSGFLSKGTVTVYFGNEPIQNVPASADGSFELSFNAPAKIAGTYTIKVTDGTNTRELAFVVTTTASLSPATSPASPGFVGQRVTIGGVGFVPDKDVVVNYDGKLVAAGKVNSDSNFSITFNAPTSAGGEHTLTVSDGINVVPLKYYMDTTAPPPPSLIAPAVGDNQRARAVLKWSAVSDPSGVTYEVQIATDPNFDRSSIVLDESGLSSAEYQVPAGQELKPAKNTAPYFWRVNAKDGASNVSTWSDTSYFTVNEPTPGWVPWMFVGLGAVIIVLFGFWLGRRSSSKPVVSSTADKPKN